MFNKLRAFWRLQNSRVGQTEYLETNLYHKLFLTATDMKSERVESGLGSGMLDREGSIWSCLPVLMSH